MKIFRNRSGASAIEFAMIAPIIVLLMMGVIEFGLILFTYASAQNTTRNVVRMLATNQISTTEAQSDCLNGLPTWVNGSASVSIVESAPSDPSSNMITVEIMSTAEQKQASVAA